jgi:hypothetical protein
MGRRGLIFSALSGFGLAAAAIAPWLTPTGGPRNHNEPAPRIRLLDQEVNFGTILAGSVHKKNVRVTNVGNAPLEILSVTPSCGCTTGTVATRSIAPGETTTLEVAFNSNRKRGEYHGYVNVESNDQESGTQRIKVAANVTELITINPSLISLAGLQVGESTTRKIHIDCQIPLQMTSFVQVDQGSERRLIARSTIIRESQGVMALEFTASALATGKSTGRVVIAAKNETRDFKDTIYIPFTVDVQGPIVLDPGDLWFILPLRHGTEKAIRIASRRAGEPAPTIESLDFDEKVINVTLVPGGPKEPALLRVRPVLNAMGSSAKLSTEIRIAARDRDAIVQTAATITLIGIGGSDKPGGK